ncbi:MBL fold metallo-hydrolase [Alteromonas stellipolaris]|uniref:MBL fold metallo-hydrolase n=1 Tax=Alteromonas stellipolaris TaxID=233316 RepID=UPI002493DAC8|nr:MBL fold metallo-hydrolase [Alteromonas stellipolaris]
MHYPAIEQPSPGEWTEIAKGVLWLRMPLPFELDHINLYLVEDDDGWVVIDTGLGTNTTKTLWKEIFAALDKPISAVLVTHLHPDHVGLAGWIADQFKVPLYMSQVEYFTARAFTGGKSDTSAWRDEQYYHRAGLQPDDVTSLMSGNKGYSNVVSPIPISYRRLKQSDVLTLKGNSWEVMIGRGHSPEHVCLYSKELGILLAGDHILPQITPNIGVYSTEPEGNTLQDYLSTLLPFTDLPEKTLVLPAHRQPFVGVKDRVNELIEHHHGHLNALVEACSKPQTVVELLPVLFKRELSGRNVVFAVAECVSHLNYLLSHGKITRHLSDDGIYLYGAQQ